MINFTSDQKIVDPLRKFQSYRISGVVDYKGEYLKEVQCSWNCDNTA